jgi:hypothetical protein
MFSSAVVKFHDCERVSRPQTLSPLIDNNAHQATASKMGAANSALIREHTTANSPLPLFAK